MSWGRKEEKNVNLWHIIISTSVSHRIPIIETFTAQKKRFVRRRWEIQKLFQELKKIIKITISLVFECIERKFRFDIFFSVTLGALQEQHKIC